MSFAYYYTDWRWPDNMSDMMKSMLLFFDGIALAAPPDRAAELIDSDPVLAGPLAEQGLLRNFDPDMALDPASAKQLAKTLRALVRHMPFTWSSGAPTEGSLRMEGHWGGGLARTEGIKFERLLIKRGLATPELEAGLLRMHPRVNLLVLLLFAQALQRCLADQQVTLHAVTGSPDLAQGFLGAVLGAAYEHGGWWNREDTPPHLSDVTWQLDPEHTLRFSSLYDRRRPGKRVARRLYGSPFREPVAISEDLRNVGADLSAVPLDEILDFRATHGRQYREYARRLQEYLAKANQPDFARASRERREAIKEEAAALRRVSRAAFGVRSATLLISLCGATWTLRQGDSVGSLLAALAATAQAVPLPGDTVTAYSYLLQIRSLSR